MTCSTLEASFHTAAALWHRLIEQRDRGSVFLTPQWQETWWDHYGGDSKELLLLAVGDESGPLGLAPMVRDGDTLSFLGSTDLFDYHDFILGQVPPADFYPTLASCLSKQPWRVLRLESIPEESAALQHLPDRFRADGYTVVIEQEDVVPGLPLPASWDHFLSGLRKKDRHELRRKLRRLDDVGAYRLVHATPESLEEDLDLFLDLMRESSDEKRDFMVPQREAFLRAVASRMQEAGYLRLSFLELDGQRVAGVICFDYAGSRFLYNSGYRVSFRRYSVGLMLKALCLQEAIESGLTYFDFLRGAEPYKYHLGAQNRGLYRMVVQR